MPYSVRERKFRKEISVQNYLYIIETLGGHSGEVGEENRKGKKKFSFYCETRCTWFCNSRSPSLLPVDDRWFRLLQEELGTPEAELNVGKVTKATKCKLEMLSWYQDSQKRHKILYSQELFSVCHDIKIDFVLILSSKPTTTQSYQCPALIT